MSESQQATPEAEGTQLLADMRNTALMPPLSSERGANVYSEWRRSQQVIADLLAYQEGTMHELRVLVRLVGELLRELSASYSNGSAHWISELPKGKAPGFRRALNALIKHFKRHGADVTHVTQRSTEQ